jgi:hypothetical protein
MADVGDAYRRLSKPIEADINRELTTRQLRMEFEEWTFIAIILPPTGPAFKELVRGPLKRRALEFKLRIDHEQFLRGTDPERRNLIFDALERSIGLMPKLKVELDDCRILKEVLATVRRTSVTVH